MSGVPQETAVSGLRTGTAAGKHIAGIPRRRMAILGKQYYADAVRSRLLIWMKFNIEKAYKFHFLLDTYNNTCYNVSVRGGKL